MPSQDHDEGGVSFALPADVDDWLAEEAARSGETRGDVCRRLLTAVHAAASDESTEPVARDDIAELRGQLEAQREEFTEHLEDVRSRVVQVKRETDDRAPADHEHPDAPSAADLEALGDDLSALETTVENGFDNFETVLEGVLEETDELAERSTLLAQAVVDLREQRAELAEQQRRRTATDRLKLAANRLGIGTAVCADCDASVEIALLTVPECPHCASEFTDVAEKSSLFGSPRLLTGDPPALEGRVETPDESPPEAVFAAVESDAEFGDRDADPSIAGGERGGCDR